MQLDVNGQVQPRAQAQALRDAVAQRSASGECSITLEDADGSFLQAFARPGEHFRLTAQAQGTFGDGLSVLRADEALAALLDYLDGGSAWREAIAWRGAAQPMAGEAPGLAPGATQAADVPGGQDVTDWIAAAGEELRAAKEGRALAQAPGAMSPLTLAATLALLALFGWGVWRLWVGLHARAQVLPWPWDAGAGLAIGVVALAVTLVCVLGLLGRGWQLRRMARWQAVPGQIEQAQAATAADEGIANFQYDLRAQLRYRFEWQGRKRHGSRIALGPQGGGLDTTNTLQRYPVGRAVTVYVNPQDPQQTVLELDSPTRGLGDALWLLLGVWGLAWIFAALWRSGGQWLQGHPAWLAQAREPRLAALAGAMGLLTLLIVLAGWVRRQRAARWPATAGTVSFSGVRSDIEHVGNSRSTVYQARVEYRYEVGGQHYTGRQLGLTPEGRYDQRTAEARAARYPQGKAVQVRYNPQEPGQAYVETGSLWILGAMLLAALALCGFAAYQAGLV